MSRTPGGSWVSRIAALAVYLGLVGAALFAADGFIRTPYSWVSLYWAGGLVVGVLAVPRLLTFVYEHTVVRTWTQSIMDAAPNRRWWLAQYTHAMTRPYGLLTIAAVLGWRGADRDLPLGWPWCVAIIAFIAVLTLVTTGGIPSDPEMPYVRRIPFGWRGFGVLAAIAAAAFATAHFLRYGWLHLLVFIPALFVIAFWSAVAIVGGARLFLRADYGTSTSYPVDWPWDGRKATRR
jgi:hypothetical protein